MNINLTRLKSNILKIGEIGRKKGEGITRLAFSDVYYKASDVFKDLMKDAELKVKTDRLGNVFGKREGENNDLPSIMIGSHMDTVKNGGLFDGNLGVNAALECIYVLEENNIKTKHPIEIVSFNAEEGSEMGGTFGSRVMVGLQDPLENGLADKLKKYGLTLNDVKSSIRNTSDIKAFLELHIEQGGDLFSKDIPIGIVKGIAGITRYRISALGEANHAGTTPMNLRKDAMMGASKLMVEIEKIAKNIGAPFVATIGVADVFPGAINIIPGRVELILEMRDLNQERIEKAVNKIKKSAQSIGEVDFKFELLINKPPVKTSRRIVQCIEEACIDKNIPYQIMASGAGHDAKAIANKVPTGMIFVPSKDGKSHCPDEWTDWEDIKKGTEILLDTIIRLDKIL